MKLWWKFLAENLHRSKNSCTFAPGFENGCFPEWPNGADCKSAVFRLRWFESISTHQRNKQGCEQSHPFFILCIRAHAHVTHKRCTINVFSHTNSLCSHTNAWCISKEKHFLRKTDNISLWVTKIVVPLQRQKTKRDLQKKHRTKYRGIS